MSEQLRDLSRTHTCGALRAEHVGADVVLLGWVHRVRDLGGVTFIDLRDRAGISQVVVRDNDALMAVAKRLRSEYVVGVLGVVQRRSDDTINPKIATGEVEVLAREIRVLNEAKTPPFQIADESTVSEDVRLRYRYLDLRRTRMLQAVWREIGHEIKTPFRRIPYAEAIARYGSDKPDLRFGLEIEDLSDLFRDSEFRVFKQIVADGGVVRGFTVPGGNRYSRSQLDVLVDQAKQMGFTGLIWVRPGEPPLCSVKALSEAALRPALDRVKATADDLL